MRRRLTDSASSLWPVISYCVILLNPACPPAPGCLRWARAAALRKANTLRPLPFSHACALTLCLGARWASSCPQVPPLCVAPWGWVVG